MVSEKEIPERWEWKEFGEVVESSLYGLTAKADEDVEGMPFLRITDINDRNELRETPPKKVRKEDHDLEKYTLEYGDIVVARSGATSGKSYAYREDDPEMVYASYLIRFSLDKSEVLPEYIQYLMKSSYYWNWVENTRRKSAQSNINAGEIKSFEVPIPSLEEQQMIVEKLDEIFNNIRNIQDAQEQAEEKYEIAFNSALREYIPSKDSDIETVRFGDIGEIYGGGTPSRSKDEYWGGSIPWVSAKDMGERRISDSQDHMTEEAFENSSAAKEVPENALIFVMRSSILEHTFPVAITEEEITINQDLKALIPKDKIDPEYLLYTLLRYEKRILKKCSKEGTTVASLDSEPLYDFELPLPPKEEQRNIVSKVKEIDSKLNEITDRVDAHNEKVEDLPKSVLLEAFKGNLVDYQSEESSEGQGKEPEQQKSFQGEGQQTLTELS